MPRRRPLARLIVVNLLLLAASLIWLRVDRQSAVSTAFAKSSQMLALNSASFQPLNHAQLATLATESITQPLQFVSALPMTLGEGRTFGCGHLTCAHVTHYDKSSSGTLETVIDQRTEQVVAQWRNPQARPAGSEHVLDEALRIAARDGEVTAVLGNIGDVDPAMVPMSAWLADGGCAQQWCVDLTFHDPSGSGKIVHVFVNMENERVERTFTTRGRADIAAAPPTQRGVYQDGCHEQYDWLVCWEMTAHDGVNFRDAMYKGTPIFTSAKIPQIEAWYPSWPGGYRDEIGFSATVPPFDATELNDLDNGFEIRQLFTEFTRWPNCICCYRYEQILRLFADGTMEFRFTSHGPGCDDLSIYRPFWRIDLDLDGGDGDAVWQWEESEWVEKTAEYETYPFVEDLSPDGAKLATFDGDFHYRWLMARTDPLGLDEARFFAVAEKEGEGDGPLTTGPGDTFRPPRQWIDDEPLSGEDIVLWFVPLLKTKKTNPLWCMPDPEPGINECEAIIVAFPAGELVQPSEAELAAMETATPVPTVAPSTPAPTPTHRPVEGDDPETILLNAGCGVCHAIGSLGEAGKVGPDLSNIGAIAAERVPDLSAEEYLRQAILEPNAHIVPDCPNGACLANIMPQNYDALLSEAQLDTIVAFLLRQTDEPLPPSIGSNATPAPKAFPAPKKIATAVNPISSPPLLAVQILLVTLVTMLVLFRLAKRPLSEENER